MFNIPNVIPHKIHTWQKYQNTFLFLLFFRRKRINVQLIRSTHPHNKCTIHYSFLFWLLLFSCSFFSITISVSLSTPDCFSLRPWSIISVPRLNPSSPIFFPNPGKNLFKTFSTCTVENPHIINSIYFRSIIKENDFNGKDQDRIYSNNYHSRW